MNHSAAICLFLLLAGCSSSTEAGVTLEVVSAPTAAGERPIETDFGYRVEIAEAWWTISRVELVTCEASLLQRAYDALIPAVHAHGVSTPTASAVPVVESLLGVEPTRVASLAPPAARYCGVRVTYAAADADAEFLEQAPGMMGHSVSVIGSYQLGDGERHDFGFVSALSFEPADGALELDLSRTGAVERVVIEKDARRWFDGVDFATLDAVGIERAFLENLARSITLRNE